MLVLLKIPLVYLCLVVWWAIRAEPRDGAAAVAPVRVTDTPVRPTAWSRPRAGPRGTTAGRRAARARGRPARRSRA